MRSAGAPPAPSGPGLDSLTAAIVAAALEDHGSAIRVRAAPRLLLGPHPRRGAAIPGSSCWGGSYCCTRKSTVRVSLPLSITSTLYLPFGQLSWLLRVKWTRSSPFLSV